MRENWFTQIIGDHASLVPYQKKFVEKYHLLMSDPYILEMTASEPLSIEEEYEMQQTWLQDPNSESSMGHTLILPYICCVRMYIYRFEEF